MKYLLISLALALTACTHGFYTQGKDGTSCTAIQELTGVRIQCTDGTIAFVNNGATGATGATGAAGTNGVDGSTGPQGPTGSPGTVVTPIQFCPNVTANYPTNFPEYGLCINNQIYGVYSANDGFLALLPPGAYSSNAIGNSCNFTITANCGVQ
jgi:hypothetical protein